MTLKITVVAEIDAANSVKAIRLPALKNAEIGVAVRVKFDGHVFGCDTLEEALELVKELAKDQRPTTSEESSRG